MWNIGRNKHRSVLNLQKIVLCIDADTKSVFYVPARSCIMDVEYWTKEMWGLWRDMLNLDVEGVIGWGIGDAFFFLIGRAWSLHHSPQRGLSYPRAHTQTMERATPICFMVSCRYDTSACLEFEPNRQTDVFCSWTTSLFHRFFFFLLFFSTFFSRIFAACFGERAD